MEATPNYGFAIPNDDGTDLWDADLWRTPITQIDTKLKDRYDTSLAFLKGSGAVDIVATDIALVNAAGFTVTTFFAVYRGGLTSVYMNVSKTTSAITPPADGDLANVTIATYTNTGKGKFLIPLLGNGNLNSTGGPMLQGYITSGGIALGAGVPGGVVNVGGTFTLAGSYAVAI